MRNCKRIPESCNSCFNLPAARVLSKTRTPSSVMPRLIEAGHVSCAPDLRNSLARLFNVSGVFYFAIAGCNLNELLFLYSAGTKAGIFNRGSRELRKFR